jgi:anti-sigma regulatory factor (Ser/Thr protein kinase)
MEEKIVIVNKVEELPVLSERMEEIGEKWNWPIHFTMNINLVLEEAVSNIIFYAFSDKESHNIDISVKMVNAKVTIEIEDEGIPFDPTLRKKPDITLPVQERPIGGLGIFLILKMMDTVRYKRENNKNILTLIKKVSHESS